MCGTGVTYSQGVAGPTQPIATGRVQVQTCHQLYQAGVRKSGLYTLSPRRTHPAVAASCYEHLVWEAANGVAPADGTRLLQGPEDEAARPVWCDMTTAGGGWDAAAVINDAPLRFGNEVRPRWWQ